MELNASRVRASELYLVTQWHFHTGSPTERRSTIFSTFVKLGMQKRWEWHRAAENHSFSEDEKAILESARTSEARSIAFWMTESSTPEIVLMTTDKSALKMSQDEPKYRTAEEVGWYVCEYQEGGSPFQVLPEIAYSLSMFDDPEDVIEAREASVEKAREEVLEEPEMSLWVSGVFWLESMIVWVDEFGETIKENVCDRDESREDVELFETHKPFETSWWLEGTKLGKYAESGWW